MEGIMDAVTSAPLDFDKVNVFEMTKFLTVVYSMEDLTKHGLTKTLPIRQVDDDNTNRRNITLEYLDTETYTKTVN